MLAHHKETLYITNIAQALVSKDMID